MNSEDKVPTASILPSQVTAKVGDEVKLFCDARGVPNPKVYWTRDNSRTKISHRRLLHIDSVEESDAGEYHCRAKNRKGSSRVSATLNIVGKYNNYFFINFVQLVLLTFVKLNVRKDSCIMFERP